MKYVILNTSELGAVDFSEVKEGSSDTLSYSLDGTQTFVKYEGDQPSFLSGKQEYTHEEILSILSGPEWSSDEII